MLICHLPSTRPRCTVRRWIYKELALFPSYTCPVCSRQQVPRDHLHGVHQYIMIRYLDKEFDMVVDCVANGTVPDLDGTTEVRHYLEVSVAYRIT